MNLVKTFDVFTAFGMTLIAAKPLTKLTNYKKRSAPFNTGYMLWVTAVVVQTCAVEPGGWVCQSALSHHRAEGGSG